MKNRALYLIIPLAVLAGCSLFPREPESKGTPTTSAFKSEGSTYKCFEKERCRVTVVVTACSATGITTEPYTLRVTRRLRDVPIVWTLRAPPGFTFAKEAVFFKNEDLAAKQFTASKSGSHEFVWRDANTTPGRFPYGIKLRHEGKDCVLDPIVINDDTDRPEP
jgi:hypothetical protein